MAWCRTDSMPSPEYINQVLKTPYGGQMDPHLGQNELTHWAWVMHKCVSKLTIIGSDNGLSPGRRQAIIWTNAGMLLIWPLGTNFIEILIRIQTFSFKKMHLKMASATWRPFCLGLNELNITIQCILRNMHKVHGPICFFFGQYLWILSLRVTGPEAITRQLYCPSASEIIGESLHECHQKYYSWQAIHSFIS